jgi:ubiquinol-cytochrome c reductase iron-sulfur subunit
MRALGRWLVAALLLLIGRRRPRAERPERPQHEASGRDELLTLALLAAVSAACVAFAIVYFTDASTQWLGVTLGLAFGFAAAAAGLAGMTLVSQKKHVEPRPELEHPEEREEVARELREPGEGLTRRRLLLTAAGGAVAALLGALALPALSLGPGAGGRLTRSPWRRGRRLVDEDGRPIAAADIGVGNFLTAFPEGADKENFASPLVVVRLRSDELRLPSDRAEWAPRGILAFSRICTHAGCAVALFRYPLYGPRSPKPALVCPCHYSTFDVARGGHRIFGPADRALPQLPLSIDAQGNLVAAGDFSGRVGPSWWEVRKS